jgi:hypothetical protein
MKILPLVLIMFLFTSYRSVCQIGGEGTYRFLDLTNSAKIAALGGTQIAFTDNNLELAFCNPSLLSDSARNQLSINYANYIAGIGVGYAAFAPNLTGKGTFAAGIHYVNYGTFEGAGETGESTGSFRAAEYALNLYYSMNITPQIRVGVNVKPIFSSFERYQSFGLAVDLGMTWVTKERGSVIAVVARNLGSQLKSYYENGNREKLPLDIQLGFSRKLSNAPVKFLATFSQLNLWNITFREVAADQNQPVESTGKFTSDLMSHLILGGEFYPTNHLTLRLGYNYRRQKELSLEARPGLVGFSAGLGVKLPRFTLDYGVANFHLAATVHYFSLSTNLTRFIR